MRFRKRGFRALVLGLLAAAGLALAPAAFARGHIGVGIYLPGVSIGYGGCRHCGGFAGVGYGGYGGYYGGYYAPVPVYYDAYYDAPYYPAYTGVVVHGDYYNRHHYYRGGYYYRDRGYYRYGYR